MFADVPTLFLATVVASLLTALASMAVSEGQDRVEGLGLWAGAMLAHAVVYALFALRGQVPDFLSIVLANALLAAVYALALEAVGQFLQQPLPRWLVWAPVPLTGLSAYVWLDSAEMRQLIVCAWLLLLQLLLIGLLWRHRRAIAGRGKYLLGAGCLLLCVVLVMRVALVLSGVVDMSRPHANVPVQGLSFIAAFSAVMLCSFGFAFMTKERSDARNRELSLTDALTGLPNRRAIMEVLQRQMAQANRNALPLGLLMVDVDHFKRINDGFGHLSGDEVLRGVAGVIAERIRTQDIAGRFGGEEFLIVLPNTTSDGARELAEALRANIGAKAFGTARGAAQVTASIGVHAGMVGDPDNIEAFIERADRALYQAKAEGRNRVEVA